jgi:hypothetical protein
MKVLLVLLVATVAVVFAGYEKDTSYGHYEPGLRHVPDGVASNYQNAARQLYVNHVAEKVGSGTGTARWEGVPGTGGNYGYHGYGDHGRNHGYGYARY